MFIEIPGTTTPVTRRSALGLLGIGVAGTALAACSKGSGSTSGGSEFTVGFAYDAPPKGSYNFLGGISDQVNLAYLGDLVMMPGALYLRAEQSWNYLLADDSSAQSKDGTTFTYVVRKGLKWSDGSPVTGKDVYATWVLRWALSHQVFGNIDRFEQTDDTTVTFHIATPGPSVQYYLLRERIMPESVYGKWSSKIGPLVTAGKKPDDKEVAALTSEVQKFKPESMLASGPYEIDYPEVTDASLILTKNKRGYHASDVGFDRIKVYNGEVPVLSPLVLSGAIDYTTVGFPKATLSEIRKKGMRVILAPGWWGTALWFSFGRVPEFKDPRVRQAFAHAINREQNAKLVGPGAKGVELLTGIPDLQVPAWLDSASRAKLQKYSYNKNKAEQLLKAAGWTRSGSGWRTPQGKAAHYDLVYAQDYPKYVTSAQDVADQLGALGIKITLVGESFTQAPVDMQAGKFQLGLAGWGSAGNPYPAAAFEADFIDNSAAGLPATQPGIDFDMHQTTKVVGEIDLQKAVEASARGANPTVLKPKVTEVALAFNELLPIVPLYENIGANPVNTKKVTGFPPDNDPVYQNSPYSLDNYVVPLLYEGRVKPA